MPVLVPLTEAIECTDCISADGYDPHPCINEGLGNDIKQYNGECGVLLHGHYFQVHSDQEW